jgi:glutamyl-tRNA synthetase
MTVVTPNLAATPVVTRFAPSPTGYLHIGGARTALFNWLFARHHQGTFLLRIEDTDRARSTQDAIEAIFDGMRWLGLEWDGEAIFQFARAERHAEVARQMVESGHAYYCYTPQEEVNRQREQAMSEGKHFRFESPWREAAASSAPKDIPPVIRIKAPREGTLTIQDEVQGEVSVACQQLDDMILLRSDGTPTYMLAVVVDDHDMGVTHIIRGDDHLNNAFRQSLIYQAMGWKVPVFAHIPLIHGQDGAKLSKRHGALGVDAYREMGYLPEAMRNYLLRLGWSHGDEEIISTEQAMAWFGLEAVGQSPSRFDTTKLDNLNGHYLREAEDSRLLSLLEPFLERLTSQPVSDYQRSLLLRAMPALKQRAHTLVQLAEGALPYVQQRPVHPENDEAKEALAAGKVHLAALHTALQSCEWTEAALDAALKDFVKAQGIKFKDIGVPLRVAVIGKTQSTSIAQIMEILGREETLTRISDIC